MSPGAPTNPFPGLRPYQPEENYIYFGRERQIDELLRRLRETRFLVLTGSSGSGKSSLVRAGLIPALQSGMMARAGSKWRIAVLRPGADPIGNVASALVEPGVIGPNPELPQSAQTLMEVTLRRSALGVQAAVEEAQLPASDNLLILVDQFEELFRFRASREAEQRADDAVAFVKLLLNASQSEKISCYVVLTMRADFIGDCMLYPGLPEAVNAGQYLVPRMSRDQLRSAITGPVAVAGGSIAPRLVTRLLNDAGDDYEQLPVLQHALMRTWDYWIEQRDAGEAMDIRHYEAVGGVANALSRHADEAYEEAAKAGLGELAERMFQALTDTVSDSRGVRRPTPVRDLAAIAGVPVSDVTAAIEMFRRPGRSFLTPSPPSSLEDTCIIDISHESLMRRWTRLAEWTEADRRSANSYLRIARAARWYAEGSAGLLRDPELEIGLRWREGARPTRAWAERIDPDFDQAMAFLDRSREVRERERAERRRARKRLLSFAWGVAAILALALATTLWFYQTAQRRLAVARDAVNTMVEASNTEGVRVAAELPQIEQFRRGLLEKAQSLYSQLSSTSWTQAVPRSEIAAAHARLGDIESLLDQPEKAISEYAKAIQEFERLGRGSVQTRVRMADTLDGLSRVEATLPDRHADALRHDDRSVELFTVLHREEPNRTDYTRELARVLDNRAILNAGNSRFDQAEADYLQARRLLETIVSSDDAVRQESARVYDNTGLLYRDMDRLTEARGQFQSAIAIGESLIRAKPENWDYKLETAKYYRNMAMLLHDLGELKPAEDAARRALALLDELARPAPSLDVDRASAHTVLAQVLELQGLSRDAAAEYTRSLELFRTITRQPASSVFHVNFGNALFDQALALRERGANGEALGLLLSAVEQHDAAHAYAYLAWDYCYLAKTYQALGLKAQAKQSLEKLSGLLPAVPQRDRGELQEESTRLSRQL